MSDLLAALQPRPAAQAAQAAPAPDGTSIAAQIAFLRTLTGNPEQAAQFRADPQGYCRERGVALHPEVIRMAVDAALFGNATRLGRRYEYLGGVDIGGGLGSHGAMVLTDIVSAAVLHSGAVLAAAGSHAGARKRPTGAR